MNEKKNIHTVSISRYWIRWGANKPKDKTERSCNGFADVWWFVIDNLLYHTWFNVWSKQAVSSNFRLSLDMAT